MKHHKPAPIRRREVKPLGWKRELRTEFVVPRLNEPSINTQAFGFIDPRRYDWGDTEDRKR